MLSKKNSNYYMGNARPEKRYRFSIRKLNVGVVSVAISAFMFWGGMVASADSNISNGTVVSGTKNVEQEKPSSQAPAQINSDMKSLASAESVSEAVATSVTPKTSVEPASVASAETSSATTSLAVSEAQTSVASSASAPASVGATTNEQFVETMKSSFQVVTSNENTDPTSENNEAVTDNNGYTVSAPEAPAVRDPYADRYSYEVVHEEKTGVDYVFSIDPDKKTSEDLLADNSARYVYVTRVKEGALLTQERIDRAGQPGTKFTYNNTTNVNLINNKALQLATVKPGAALYTTKFNRMSVLTGRSVSSVNIAKPVYAEQLTKYVDELTGTEVHKTKVQSGWTGYNYTTAPLELKNYKYVRSTTNKNGVLNSEISHAKGEVIYKRTQVSVLSDGKEQQVTLYRKTEYIDDDQTAVVKIYLTPRVNEGEETDAKRFFDNLGFFKIYTDKVYTTATDLAQKMTPHGVPSGTFSSVATNDKEAYYLARSNPTTSNIMNVYEFFKEPGQLLIPVASFARVELPYVDTATLKSSHLNNGLNNKNGSSMPSTVTYFYVPEGKVVVNYVNRHGKELKTVVNTPTTPLKKNGRPVMYDTSGERLLKFVTSNGQEYELVPAGSYAVGQVDAMGRLVSSAAPTGQVAKGTQTVTYVYQKAKTTSTVPSKQNDSAEKSTPTFVDEDGTVIVIAGMDDGHPQPSQKKHSRRTRRSVSDKPVIVDGIDPSELPEYWSRLKGPEWWPEGVPYHEPVDNFYTVYGEHYDFSGWAKEVITDVKGQRYRRVRAGNYKIGKVDAQGHLEESAPIAGKASEKFDPVIFVYRKIGNYLPYITNDPQRKIPKVPYDDFPEKSDDNLPLPYISGYTPKDKNGKPLKLVDLKDPTKGYIPPPIADLRNISIDTPVPYYKDQGDVVVKYVNVDNKKIADDVEDTPAVDLGTAYDTSDHRPRMLEKDGQRYLFKEIKPGDHEKGHVKYGTTTVTYIYQRLGKYVPFVPTEPNKDLPKVPYDDTPEDPTNNSPLPYIPGYTPKTLAGTPLEPKDPNDPKRGYIPPELVDPNDPSKDTLVPYVKNEDPSPAVTEKGSVEVRYVNQAGEQLKEPVFDEYNVAVGTSYNTTDHRVQTLQNSGQRYLFKEVKSGDQETGEVKKGLTTVTYIYQVLGSYIPYFPYAPDKEITRVPYDDTPADPLNNTPLPYIPDHTPSSLDGLPLKPVDPNDLSRGYIPPMIVAPNDPSKNTPVPYNKNQGKVIVKYVNVKNEKIANDYEDTPNVDVGTYYDTSDSKLAVIESGDHRYIFKEVKPGDQEKGQVKAGTTTVTYIYRRLGNYIPFVPTEPDKKLPKVPYDSTPEEPRDNLPLPYVPGYTPKDPTGTPLEFEDPKDPTEGYIPPTLTDPSDPGRDTLVPYDKDGVPETPVDQKGSIEVRYVDEIGEQIKEPVFAKYNVAVGTRYNTTKYKLRTFENDGNRYLFKEVKSGDKEKGKVKKGTITVTYIYHRLGNYVPFVPNEPDKVIPKVPYDDTPEDPKNNQPLPYVPGYTPKGPDGTPLKPVDPQNPTRGYVPPELVDPNDPSKDTQVPYDKNQGKVVVKYVNEENEQLADDVEDTPNVDVGTAYDTSDHRPKVLEKDGQRYLFKEVKPGDQEKGQVKEGTTTVTYVYQKLGNYVPFVPNEPDKVIPKVPYDDTPEDPKNNQPMPYVPGYTPKDPDGTPLKPVDPHDPTRGYVPPTIVDPNDPSKDTQVPYVKDEVPPTPVVEKGSVEVRYVDEKGTEIKEPVFDKSDAVVGTDYDTTKHRLQTLEKDGQRYLFKEVKPGDQEKGQVKQGTTTVTYVYQKLGNYVPFVPNEPDKVIPKVPYDDTPEDPKDNQPLPYLPGYTPKDSDGTPLKPVDPQDPTKGYVPPKLVDPNDPSKDTQVPYDKDEVPPTPIERGSVEVRYVDEKGVQVKEPVFDESDVVVGTDYDTTRHRLQTLEKDGQRYLFKEVKPGDQEKGQVKQGTTTVTYVYQKLGNYVPFVPNEPDKVIPKVPYDDTPEDPKNNQPLPYVPGYTPKDPKGAPLKPVDPQDPTKGYVPPKLVDPNDPSKDTQVPYDKDEVPPTPVEKGSVEVHYVDEKSEQIKNPVFIELNAVVGTDYDTTKHRLRTLEKDGQRYLFKEVKPGDQEKGQVKQGTTTVTYVYQKLGNYVPFVPNEPDKVIPKVPYDDTPEDPKNNQPLPYVSGYTPKDPDGTPLKPVDPHDPTRGYVPPTIVDPNDPSKDTQVPYDKDEVPPTPVVEKGSVEVHYVDEKDTEIKEPVFDESDVVVGTDYDTTKHRLRTLEKDGQRYLFKEVKPGDQEKGQVKQGTTTVTYVYQKLGNYVPFVPNEPDKVIPKVPYDDTPEDPKNNQPMPYVPGYTPKDSDGTPLKPVDPQDPTKGYVPPKLVDPNDPSKDTQVPYTKNEVLPTPVVEKGNVEVHYVDEKSEQIKNPVFIELNAVVGTDYDTTKHRLRTLEKDSQHYLFKEVKPGDQEKGQVKKGTTTVTYVYQKLGNYVPFVPNEPDKVIPKVPYDDTPEDPKNNQPLPYVPGYTPKDPDGTPLKPVDPQNPTKGYVPPKLVDPNDPSKDTQVPYVKDEVPPTPVEKGSVEVQYVDEKGVQVKEPVFDESDVVVGTDYDTTKHRLRTLEKDGQRYLFKEVKPGDQEKGQVKKGTTTVTYVYQKLGNYVPFVPNEPDKVIPKVPYDDTPEDPKDNPSLPYLPGYTPKGPDGTPLRPVDPQDPAKGYVPPKLVDPNDPSKDTQVPYDKDEVPPTPVVEKGNVEVHYVDEKSEQIKNPVFIELNAVVGTDYDTTKHRLRTLEKDGQRYLFKEVKPGDQEKGQVKKGTTTVTYVYQKLGNYVPFVPNEPDKVIPKVPYDDTPEDPKNNQPMPYVPGYTPKDPNGTPLKPVDPQDPTKGYVPPKLVDPNDPSKDTQVPYVKDEVPPMPVVEKGSVEVHYVDEKGTEIKTPVFDEHDVTVGTDYDTTEHRPRTFEKSGQRYLFKEVKPGDQEKGQVKKGTTTVTYVYQKLGNYVPFVPNEPDKVIPKVPYDDTPEDPKDNSALPYVPGYTPKGPDGTPLKPVDPQDPTKGYVPPKLVDPNDPSKDTQVPYVKDEVPPMPVVEKGSVEVRYVDEKGTEIKAPVFDEHDVTVGTDYDTTEYRPRTFEKAGQRYLFKEVKPGDQEKGRVKKGTTTVTYVYQKLGNYVPFVPNEPDKVFQKVPYDNTPEDPTNNPPLPYVPGYTPKDPDGTPLKPVDPQDPTRGYVPPTIVDPNDPSKDTQVPYVKDEVPPTPVVEKGSVEVRYVDEKGTEIKAPVFDEHDVAVGTDYDTTEHRPQNFEESGQRYLFKEVKSGDKEKGQVKKGTTTVTYVYQKLGNYVPFVPNEPDKVIPKVPYDDTPEDPKDNPSLPYVPGYTPKDPDGTTLKPVDPNDPTRGYVPPTIVDPNDPSKDTRVPYVKDEVPPTPVVEKGSVEVRYVDEKGTEIKAPVFDEHDVAVGTDYDTTEYRPQNFEESGQRYLFKEVKSGDKEKGQVKKGTTTVTYVYQKLGNYVPFVPNEPDKVFQKVPYDNTPEDPTNNPPLPYVLGYTPKGINGMPLKLVDPQDPTKGYVPPKLVDPNDPSKDTLVPYEREQTLNKLNKAKFTSDQRKLQMFELVTPPQDIKPKVKQAEVVSNVTSKTVRSQHSLPQTGDKRDDAFEKFGVLSMMFSLLGLFGSFKKNKKDLK